MPTDQLQRPPAAEPIHLDEAKAHLRVDYTDEDALITALITAAREAVEQYTGRTLVRQTRRMVLDAFPEVIALRSSPLRAVESITYVDTDGVTQTLAASGYRVDDVSGVPRIMPAYGESWPSTRDVTNAVVVTYSAGWAVPVSADADTDTLTGTGHGLDDDEEVQLYNSGGTLPAGLSASTPYYVLNGDTNTLQLALSAGGEAVDITGTGSGQSFVGLAPRPILQAMLLLVGHLYANREAVNVGNIVNTMPYAVEWLLSSYVVRTF